MYERLYTHSGILTEDGKVICPLCCVELDEDLMSPEPCIYDTASLVKYGGLWWFINVSNCQAELCVAENFIGHIRYRTITCNEETKDKLQELVVKSVEEHGALNISGIYGPSDELMSFIIEKGIRAE